MEMDLTFYQQEALNKILDALDSNQKKILIEMAVGTGKTHVVLYLLARLLKKSKSGDIAIFVNSRIQEEQLKHLIHNSDSAKSLNVLGTNEIHIVNSKTYFNERKHSPVSSDESKKFEIIILFDIPMDYQIGKSLTQFIEESNSYFINIQSVASQRTIDLFGNPVFEYKYDMAIQDGILLPVVINKGPNVPNLESADTGKIFSILESFINELHQENKKALILCKTKSEATKIVAVLEERSNIRIVPLLGSNKRNQEDRAIQDIIYSNESGIVVAVSVDRVNNLITNLDDVFILKKINSAFLYIKLLALVYRPFENKKVGVLWDFGGNERYFPDGLSINELTSTELSFEETVTYETKLDADIDNKDEAEIKDDVIYSQMKVVPVGDNASTKDLLGRSALIHVLAGIIEKIDSTEYRPFVISLLGKWGSGKSSVVNFLQKKLEHDKNYAFVTFNAWQNEHCNNMGAALASCLVDNLFKNKSFFHQVSTLIKYHLIKNTNSIKIFLFLIVLCLFPAVVLVDDKYITNIAASEILKSFSNSSYKYVLPFASSIALLAFTYYKNPFTSKIKQLIARPDYSEHLGVSNKIKEDLTALLSSEGLRYDYERYNYISKQYVIIIDDLDRCSDEKIFEVLESIKLIIDLPNVIVVLAVDQGVLLSAVANRLLNQNERIERNEALKLARDFLGKIIQISVELDTPNSLSLKKFIAERLYLKPDSEKIVSEKIIESNKIADDDLFEMEFNDVDTPIDLMSNSSDWDLDDEDFDYDVSDEYLESSDNEVEVFSDAVDAFDISNPRTLIRIHNSITLLKGVYPEIIGTPNLLGKYIFFVFMNELYASSNYKVKNQLNSILNNNMDKVTLRLSKKIANHAGKLGVADCDEVEKRKIISRVRKFSLPSISYLSDKAEVGIGDN